MDLLKKEQYQTVVKEKHMIKEETRRGRNFNHILIEKENK